MTTEIIHLLVTEDDDDDFLFAVGLLSSSKLVEFKIERAETLADTLSFLERDFPNAVLLDLFLPDSKALETFRAVYSRFENVPIIVITGLDDIDMAMQAVSEGAQDFLTKGKISRELMVKSVRFAVERQRTRDLIQSNLEVERKVTAQLIENSPIGLARLDPDMKIVQINEAFSKHLGDSPDKLTGKCLFDLIPDLPREKFVQAIKVGGKAEEDSYCLVLEHSPSADVTYWDLAIWPISAERTEQKGAIFLGRDVSEQVRINLQREDILSALAHDVKTVLSGTARMLRNYDSSRAEGESANDVLAKVGTSNRNLLTKVDHLIDLFRFGYNQRLAEARPQKLSEVIDDVVEELEPLANARQIALKTDLPADLKPVLADKDSLHRLFSNVLENAIKFSPPNCKVVVKGEEINGKVKVEITDMGIGISEVEINQIFQRFWRGKDSIPSLSGYGLGLYLCQRIVASHHGSIACTSELGKGTTMIIELPHNQESSS